MISSTTELAKLAVPLIGENSDFDALVAQIGDARYVLLGEASHGTHEFYRARALITQRLIAECRFSAVAVEADWPDAYRVNEFVRAESDDGSALDALSDFCRFPNWMWRNSDVLPFVEWLRAHNDTVRDKDLKAGFYGLDLYSMHASMAAVLAYLESVDDEAASRARQRYACFDDFGLEPQRYGYATSVGFAPACEREAMAQLLDLQSNRSRLTGAGRNTTEGFASRDAHFFAEQNARLVQNAERYYRMMFTEGARSWNFRDRHMMETLEELAGYLHAAGTPPRIVVWAHNSHLGDARATDMKRRGELNLGQLVREHAGDSSISVGFTTYGGTVTAASDWDRPSERKIVRPALPESVESLLHDVAQAAGASVDSHNFYLNLQARSALMQPLNESLLQRAIGVIYRPETERQSHYFRAQITRQFDALFHYDETRAVVPLDAGHAWTDVDAPDTFPSAL